MSNTDPTKTTTQKTKKMSNTDPTKNTTQKTKKMSNTDPTKNTTQKTEKMSNTTSPKTKIFTFKIFSSLSHGLYINTLLTFIYIAQVNGIYLIQLHLLP
jgi:hypothetical protein